MSVLKIAAELGQRLERFVSVREYGYHLSDFAPDDSSRSLMAAAGYDRDPTPIEDRLMAWAAVWSRNAFPVIEPSHRLAASLMCTSSPQDEICVPWGQFAVRIPSGLASFANEAGRHEVSSLLISNWSVGLLSYDAWSDDGHCITTPARQLSLLADELEESVPTLPGCASLDHDDKRLVRLLDRLVLGVCREMSSREHQQSVASGPAQGRRLRASPRLWTFKLTRPVVVNCRDAVGRYLVGGSSGPPTVQCFVRGHWRRQHYLDRVEWIQVEPYWRGPETAPIAVRPHQVS